MKRTHKGFTLVELLIVIAVIGALAIMMTMSSSEAVDVAGANAIIGNLQTLKTAAYQMYINEPGVGFVDIKFGEDTDIENGGTSATKQKVLTVLKKYVGKDANTATFGTDSGYGLVGDKTAWFVVYKLAATDTSGVKSRLTANAKKAELLGASGVTIDKFIDIKTTPAIEDDPETDVDESEPEKTEITEADYYGGEDYVALKVR